MAGLAAYAFLDFVGSVVDGAGGGSCDVSAGAGIAPEGVSVAYDEAKISKQIGADGRVMYSLHASRAGKLTVRFLKTSPNNAILSEMYRFDQASSANVGQITFTGGNVARGDNIVAKECAIMKHPDTVYNVEGPALEWTFEVGYLDMILGTGTPG